MAILPSKCGVTHVFTEFDSTDRDRASNSVNIIQSLLSKMSVTVLLNSEKILLSITYVPIYIAVFGVLMHFHELYFDASFIHRNLILDIALF